MFLFSIIFTKVAFCTGNTERNKNLFSPLMRLFQILENKYCVMSHFFKYLQKSGNIVISQINQAVIILLSLGQVTPFGMTLISVRMATSAISSALV